jgi:mono/diheme cytochrome c family protein
MASRYFNFTHADAPSLIANNAMAMRVLLTACAVLLLTMSLALTPALADESQIAAGQALYGDYCAKCHGAERRGLDNFSEDFASFTLLLSGVTSEMPDFTGFFSEEEIESLYAYLAAPK